MKSIVSRQLSKGKEALMAPQGGQPPLAALPAPLDEVRRGLSLQFPHQCWVLGPDHIEQYQLFRPDFWLAALKMPKGDPTLTRALQPLAAQTLTSRILAIPCLDRCGMNISMTFLAAFRSEQLFACPPTESCGSMWQPWSALRCIPHLTSDSEATSWCIENKWPQLSPGFAACPVRSACITQSIPRVPWAGLLCLG